MQRGKHEALIDLATWRVIQDRLDGKPFAPFRNAVREDFPLRGFATFGCCRGHVTAAWSKGRTRFDDYCVCQAKVCAKHRKSIRNETMEDAFGDVVMSCTPCRELF